LNAETLVTDDRDSNVEFSSVSVFDTSQVTGVACGAGHTIVSVSQSSQDVILAMGNNNCGQLGIDRRTDFSPRFKQIKFPDRTRFLQLSCGAYFTLALTKLGEVWVFGDHSRGQLGLEKSRETVDSPEFCSSLRGIPVCQLATGSFHSLALSTTGRIFGAGSNSQGQLAMTARQDFRTFTLLNSLDPVFVVHITAFGSYSAAIDEFGGLYLWGGKFGPVPTSTTLPSGDGFVDVALGSDGRVVALTKFQKLVVSGFFVGGEQVQSPFEVESPGLPFCRVFTGGEYFIALADRHMNCPLADIEYSSGTSLRSGSIPDLRQKMRCETQVLTFPFRFEVDFPTALKSIFGSLSSLNGSFLVDNFAESLSTTSSGIDISGVRAAFNAFTNNPSVFTIVVSSFNRLLVDLQENPPLIRLPATMRFLVIGLLLPSVSVRREIFECWRNLIDVIARLNAYQVLAQWLSVIETSQLRSILISVKEFLTQQIVEVKKMYSPLVIKAVRVVEALWFASTRTRRLAFDEFYHDAVNRHIDIRIEHQLYGDQSTRWCYTKNAPWLLNADTKTNFLRVNSRDLMHQQQWRAVTAAREFVGSMPIVTPLDIFLIIVVGRDSILLDTFQAIAQLKHPEMELKKPLKVAFKNEPGVDEGGVQREFFQLLVDKLFDPDPEFFIANGQFYWFNSEAHDPPSQQAYFLAGVLFGLAIYNGNLLNVKFPLAVYKKLRGLTMTLQDLKDFDEQLYISLNNILKYEGDVETDMCLTFSYNEVPLCPNGEDMPVTNGNREQYCDLVTQYLLVDSIRTQFDEFKKGFLDAAGQIVLDLFRPEELALLVAGREELDFVALEGKTRYEGYTADSPAVRAFWHIVHTRLTDDEKRKLLYFTTASPRAPINGLGSIPFIIGRDGNPAHVPTSHTCFFMLVLPDDPDENRMYEKLKVAIENAEGFAFK
jgi:hypothetical protein